MHFEDFKATLSATAPDSQMDELLQALWWNANDDWDRAHSLVKTMAGDDACWIHAYLHRQEGDLGNSRYWYSRAKRAMPETDCSIEWEAITRELLAKARINKK